MHDDKNRFDRVLTAYRQQPHASLAARSSNRPLRFLSLFCRRGVDFRATDEAVTKSWEASSCMLLGSPGGVVCRRLPIHDDAKSLAQITPTTRTGQMKKALVTTKSTCYYFP